MSMTFSVTCRGPGPHEPDTGILGESSIEGADWGLCPRCAALPAPREPVPLDAATEPTASPRDLSAVRERII